MHAIDMLDSSTLAAAFSHLRQLITQQGKYCHMNRVPDVKPITSSLIGRDVCIYQVSSDLWRYWHCHRMRETTLLAIGAYWTTHQRSIEPMPTQTHNSILGKR